MTIKSLLCSLLLLSNFAAFSQQFFLKGVLMFDSSHADTKVYLLKIDNLDHLFSGSPFGVVDSATVDMKGNFEFNNPDVIEDNTFYRLNVINPSRQNPGAISWVGTHENFAFFFLDKRSQISFITYKEQVSQKLVLTKSDNANYLIYKLSKIRRRYAELVDELVKRKNALDPRSPTYFDSLKEIKTQIKNAAYATNSYEDIKHFADTVSNTYVSLLATELLPDNTFQSFYLKMNERFQKEIPNSTYARKLNTKLKNEPAFLIGGTRAPDIELPDTKGNRVSLSDLKGKYVLIEFWASWCIPCRTENISYIKPLYAEYSHKGFTVLSISHDINKINWLDAIEKDGTTMWYNVSDLKGAASKVINDYRIESLPFNYVVNPEGFIIAHNLRGAELENFLKNKLQ